MRVLRLRWKPFLQRTDAWRTSCSLSGEETMSSVLDAILSLKSWCLLDHAIHVCLADYVWFDVMKEWLSGFTGETMSSMFDAILSSKSGCWLDHVIHVYLAIYVIVLFMKEWHSWFTFSLIIKLQFIQFNVHVCVTNVCCKVHNFWELSWQLESRIATIRGEFTEGCVTNGTWEITYQYMCMHRYYHVSVKRIHGSCGYKKVFCSLESDVMR